LDGHRLSSLTVNLFYTCHHLGSNTSGEHEGQRPLFDAKRAHGTHASPGEHDVRGHNRTYHKVTPREFKIRIDPFKRGHGPCKSIRKGYQVKKHPTRRHALTQTDIERLSI
jgi:hypothetical protein